MSVKDVLGSEGNVEEFLSREDRIYWLYEFDRTRLIWLADHFQIDCPSSLKKALLVQKVREKMEFSVGYSRETELLLLDKRMRMKELELEEKKLNIEVEKLRMEEHEKLEKLKMEEREKEREEREKKGKKYDKRFSFQSS